MGCPSRQLGDRPAGSFGFGGDGQIHLVLHWLQGSLRRSAHWTFERFDDSAALLFAVDFGLGLDGEAGLGELVLGPHDFGGPANLRPLDRDRGVRLQLGALPFRSRGRVAIVRCVTAP
ncbi:Uncharacterised protein [Mycobacterium tuberculosis]|nr:Uncharacterised protein [Mycobacterium tuberculosis]SGG01681.1 Uncharacterised protein [Mycobacterium tuberculosis]SGJ60449.1 Uncharacterised protein [Mycobacterium tuberculosis]